MTKLSIRGTEDQINEEERPNEIWFSFATSFSAFCFFAGKATVSPIKVVNSQKKTISAKNMSMGALKTAKKPFSEVKWGYFDFFKS